MMRIKSSRLAVVPVVMVAWVTASCGGRTSEAAQPDDTAVLVGPENILIVDSVAVSAGPTISGSLQPDQVSTIRAEIGGSVLETNADVGQRVSRGALLARIDDAAIQDAFLSARSAMTTAEQAAAIARRNLERAERLAEAGAIAERDLETARIGVTTADAQLADARARYAQAEKQLNSTRITSPITGAVSERAVNAGDVVSPGMALFTVVDPRSMKLEASVPASGLTQVRIGAPVEFSVNGYPGRTFTGRLDRISPTVDPATGQVLISASIPNSGGQLVGGVFAEGRVGIERKTALAVPASTVQQTGNRAWVLRIRNGTVERVEVQLGLVDEQAEMLEIANGVARGDTLLTGAAQGYTPGTPIRVQTLADRSTSQN
jgi:RND family efflux transporter MFP subunit